MDDSLLEAKVAFVGDFMDPGESDATLISGAQESGDEHILLGELASQLTEPMSKLIRSFMIWS